MVRVDTSRDYYADLGVPQDSSVEDVKKQFRKLALQLHPDRHPGHEDEYTARFQCVRAAHDVLSDPDQRAKYDKNRRRGNLNNNAFERPNPPRRNATSYTAPTSQFPPPPSRTNPRRNPNDAPPTPNSGASRYSNIVPPHSRTTATDDARVRQNVFQAWKMMGANQQAQSNLNPPSGAPSQSNRHSAATSPMDDGRDPRGSSAWAEVNRPSHHSRMASGRPAPPPKRPGFDPMNREGDEGPAVRVSSYNTSARHDPPETSSKYAPDLPPRGISPQGRKDDFARDDGNYSEGSRERAPYMSARHDRTELSGNESLRRAATTRESPRSGLRPNSYASPDFGGQRFTSERRRSADTTAAGMPDLNLPRAASHGTRTDSRTHEIYSSQSDESSDGRDKKPHSGKSAPRDSNNAGHDAYRSSQPRNTRARRSRVPPSEAWAQGRSPGVEATGHGTPRNASFPEVSRAATSPTGNDYIPTHSSPLNPDVTSNHVDEEAGIGHPQGFPNFGDTFEADEWARKMQEGNWASHTPDLKPQRSPKKPSGSPRRQARGSNLPDKTPPTDPEDAHPDGRRPSELDEDEANEQGIPHSERAHRESGNSPLYDPMDIDEDVPIASQDTPPPIHVHDESNRPNTRSVYVESARREWQNQPSSGERPHTYDTADAALPSNASAKPSGHVRPNSNISMSDFRHVHPFNSGGTSGEGLASVKDLSDNLPFHSRPAASHPKRSSAPREPLLRPPIAPPPPSTLTRDSWDSHLAGMTRYFRDWNTFNSRVISMLQDYSIQFRDMEREGSGNMVDGWLGIVGETETLGGWDTYVRACKEEKRLRTHWERAHAQHEAVMAAHGQLRSKILAAQVKH